jgi:murein DD-endopeptidase MepM/ murein hydrolase activator NlpD
MAGSDTRQLLLQVDASVAVAQRNLQNLARSVANDSGSMEASLGRVDRAFSKVGKSAEESAQAFIAGDRAAKGLLASIDPLFAAQHRYDTELEKANQLYKTGSLSAAEFARAQAGLKAQLEQSVTAFGRVGGTSGSLRAGMQQLSFQVGDVAQGFALGVKPMTIFAQQGGQVIQSLQLMGGASNKFLAILAGPWGIALQLAISAVVLLSSRHKDAAETVDDLVAKMKKEADQARLNEQANNIWAHSIDGVREAQKKLREEVEESIKTERVANEGKLREARNNLATQQKALADAEKRAADLQRQLQEAQSAPKIVTPGATSAGGQETRIASLKSQLEATKATVNGLKSDIADSEKTIRERLIPVAQDYAKAASDTGAAFAAMAETQKASLENAATFNKTLSGSIGALELSLELASKAGDRAANAGVNVESAGHKLGNLTKALIAGKIGPDAYTKSVNAMAKALNVAAKAAEDAKKSVGTGTGELAKFILPVQGQITSGFGARTPPTKGASSYHPAIDIAAPIGTPVKSAAGGVVIYTGKMAGLGNVVIVDHGGGTITEYGHLSKILTNKGAQIGQGDVIAQVGNTGISTGPHLDYRVKVGGKYVDPRKGQFPVDSVAAGIKAGNAAQSLADKQLRNDDAFAEAKDKLNRDLLSAQMDLVGGTEDQAKYQHILAKKAEEDADRAIQNDVSEGKLTQAQADELKAIQEQIRAQRDKNIETRKQIELLGEQDEAARDGYEFSLELLRGQEAFARTANSRRDIELQILDLVYEEKEKHLETLKAQAELAGNVAEAARIQAEINRLPAQKANETQQINRSNQGPLQNYLDGLPQSADDLNERLQNLEVQGIEGLVNALSHVGEGWKAMRDIAIQAIQDILQQLIKMQLEKMIFSLIGNLAGGGGFNSASFAATEAGNATALGLPANFFTPRASGGPVRAGQPYIVGEHRPELFVPDTSGYIVPQVPKIGVPANNNSSTYHINVMAPNTGDKRRDRATAMQQASLVREQLGKVNKRGIA